MRLNNNTVALPIHRLRCPLAVHPPCLIERGVVRGVQGVRIHPRQTNLLTRRLVLLARGMARRSRAALGGHGMLGGGGRRKSGGGCENFLVDSPRPACTPQVLFQVGTYRGRRRTPTPPEKAFLLGTKHTLILSGGKKKRQTPAKECSTDSLDLAASRRLTQYTTSSSSRIRSDHQE